MYDTHLTSSEERRYKLAAAKANRTNDTRDYDLRGAWKNNPKSLNANGHLTDRYKKPNHPTFSVESKYSTSRNPGGNWTKANGGWSFTPSKRQISRAGGLAPFRKAFNRNEAGQRSGLVIPPSY